DLTQYLITNFLLYLRVSGLFHVIVGMLYLFGFRLSETHNRYLLASSFTDFWRRINIYWKDFMQKVFYYPAVFRLRKLGTTWALVLATLYVFVMTWFLHAYQWFWLRGTMLFVLQDILFWTILGGFVVLNSLYEIKYGRSRSIAAKRRTAKDFVISVLRTYGTFWFICLLWSFWTTETLADWFSLWSSLGGAMTWDVLVWPAIILIVIVLGAIPGDTMRNLKLTARPEREWVRERFVTVAALCVLIGVSIERVSTGFGEEVATFVHSIRSGQLSRLDVAKLEKGYYENLLSVDRFNSQLWEVYSRKPANWLDVENANLKRFVGGFVQAELIPSFVSKTKYGTISINRWGMRDQDYETARALGSFRAAVLGASSVMGWGVGDGETFEAIVEARLNSELPVEGIHRYEFLNFGIPGYQPPQQLVVLNRALGFRPDAVVFVATGREPTRSVSSLVEAVNKRLPIPFPELSAIVSRAGLTPGMEESEATRRLASFRREILQTVYRTVVVRATAAGARPIFVFLPQVREGAWQEETPETLDIAREAGFVVINLEDVYRSHPIEEIRLAEWDDHPNRLGHQIVANRLHAEFVSRREMLLQPPPATSRTTARQPEDGDGP
ncbi:MAG: hypothetical protein AB7N65_30085, partial [Vicinamibacterales bacterium]